MDDETPDGFSTPSLYGQPDAPPAPPRSRRGFLIGGGIAVAVAAAGGVALGVHSGTESRKTLGPLVPKVSAELTAAAAAERALVATVDAALTDARGHAKRVLQAVRRDHAAHLAAIEAEIADDTYPATVSSSPAPGGSSSAAPVAAKVSRAAVRAAETRASRAAAARALRLTGREATLLASIAASEAAHAEVLA